VSSRWIGIGLLVVGSEILGVFVGSAFYRLFLKSVPPMSMSSLNTGAAHGAFVLYGLILGLLVAVFSLIAIGLSGLFRPRPAKT
jgi:hypothetical protein